MAYRVITLSEKWPDGILLEKLSDRNLVRFLTPEIWSKYILLIPKPSQNQRSALVFMKPHHSVFLLATLATILTAGENRTWTSADGSKKFAAEFIRRNGNQVTLVRKDGKEISFDLAKLHEIDRRWIELEHPSKAGAANTQAPDPGAIFDTLRFGDSREVVSKKLAASKLVTTAVAGVFQGRTGLNGIYQTTQKYGGLTCTLFFDWDAAGGLSEVTLQTEKKPPQEYLTTLQPCWESCIPLLSTLYGDPMQHVPMPAAESLEDGQMLASHLWALHPQGTIMLGTANDGGKYQVFIRFTTEKFGTAK